MVLAWRIGSVFSVYMTGNCTFKFATTETDEIQMKFYVAIGHVGWHEPTTKQDMSIA
jgi:hypothetical protein